MRWIGRILVTLLLLVAIVALVAWLLLAGGRPQLDGTIALHGLSAPVTITRDARGTPTIEASSRADAAYALGFVHGQERFFQMDLLRRNAAGELSELVGKAALKVDEKHRIHRFRALAETELMQLPVAQRVLLDAYTRGVNAGLNSLDVRPWEYLLLRATPQKWRAQDSLLVIDAMFLDLNQQGENTRELNFARLRAAVPKPLADFLLAPAPQWEAPLRGAPTKPVPMPGADVFDLRTAPPGRKEAAQGAAAILATANQDSGIGSNGFAVAGTLTGAGALLANDPHLHLMVPNVWYRARLRWPDPIAPNQMLDLNGVTLPGTPALVIGSNGHIAWGFTNSEGDWMDWVRVIRDPKDPSRYKTPDGWAKIQRHDELIHVHGAPDHHFSIEDTIWGPIAAKDVDGTPLALAWIAQSPRALNLNLVKLETARTVQDALGWAPLIGIPPQNLMVADSRGNIGWSIAGSAFPLRAGFDPLLPSDWTKPGTGWTGFAPLSHDPHILNPGNGRIWTANQRLVDGSALKLLGDGGYDQGARAQQIRDDLLAREHFVSGDMLNVQLDNRALFLARWQKLLLDVLAECDGRDPGSSHNPVPDGMSAACTRLHALKPYIEHWQARAAAASVGYRIVRAFHDRVREDTLAPFAALAKKQDKDFKWPSVELGEYAVWTMVTKKPAWLLDPQYKDWDALLLHSAIEVADELAKIPGPLANKTWGAFNTARIRHPLAVALPPWLARFIDMPPDPLSGDRDMPRVLHPDFGASMRLDVSPGDEAHGILEMPSGEAGNPLTPYFGSGHEEWVHGAPAPLLPGAAKYQATLVPATH
ncbi:MAG TPA: penicillin acylase family protein [Rhodanobacteraceae bacterium]|nr:penicillin acylase family protein [Rhodanobacteraceae bacterium]